MIIDLNSDKQVISKNAILKQYTEVDVFRLYIDEDLSIGKRILSPLRNEKNPSFVLFKGNTGEICFNDFLLGKGDFVKFVQMKFGLTYFEALSRVAVDLGIQGNYICKYMEKTNTSIIKSNQPTKEELLSKVVALKLGKNRREWQLHDIQFWSQFGISVKTLEYFNVEPISYIHVNGNIFKADKYAYCFIEEKDNKETYKFYQPFNTDFKWINNHDDSVWQGWDKLPKNGDTLIITKSLKDVMSLYEVTGIPAVSLQSENISPKRHVFEQLNQRFDMCYLLYDNDFDKEQNWGMIFGTKLAQELGLIDIWIPDRFKSKDFSDLVKNGGVDNAKKILEQHMLMRF